MGSRPLLGYEGVGRDFITYGGRATFNFSRLLAGEVQISRASVPNSIAPGCCGAYRLQGVAHAKITYRLERRHKFNLFGIGGPGFLTENGGYYDPQHNLHPSNRTRFAFNAGGGIEVVPSRRLIVRGEVSDFVVRTREQAHVAPYSFWDWTHWADYKLAVMFRF
jgi:hypothetical protein